MRFGIVKPTTTEKKEIKEKENIPQPKGIEEYNKIEEAIGYKFKDIDWLFRALTHRSVPQNGEQNDYERLEFLGDAVFDLSVAHLLSDIHPDAREGDLSKMRAALVNTISLADIAKKINLGPYIRLGRGELASGGHERPSILADVLEAVLGAVYRDSDYEKALACVEGLFGDDIQTVTPRDPKTELQEVLHTIGSNPPTYLLECVEGPEHAPTFVSIVEVDGEIVGRGKGPTKKASQQEAASETLNRLRPANDEIDMVFQTKDSPVISDNNQTGESDDDNEEKKASASE